MGKLTTGLADEVAAREKQGEELRKYTKSAHERITNVEAAHLKGHAYLRRISNP